jgi:hypothetical protein
MVSRYSIYNVTFSLNCSHPTTSFMETTEYAPTYRRLETQAKNSKPVNVKRRPVLCHLSIFLEDI